MEGSAPSIILMLSVDLLLFGSEHKPIDRADNEVAYNAKSIQKMMSCLKMNCAIWCLQRIFSEINCIVGSLDAWPKRDGCQDKCPVSERHKEAIEVHVQEICYVAGANSCKHQVSHSLGCINLTLWNQLLLRWEILKLSEFVELIWVVLGRNVVDVIWPVLPQICKVDWLVGGLSSSSHDVFVYNCFIILCLFVKNKFGK